ncbi:unnamed protein product [Cunninghamella blakesleeana]
MNIDTINNIGDGSTTSTHFKAFTNFMNHQVNSFGDKSFARYLSDHDGHYKTLTYSDVDRIATNLACTWASRGARNISVISLLHDHNENYLIILLALMKLRVTVLLLSTRNSEAADINLLEKTKSKVLIANVKYETIAKNAVAKASSTGDDVRLILLESLNIDDLINQPLHPDYESILDLNFSDDDIEKDALIIHSSGTTSFPKPIYLSNLYIFTMINFAHIQSQYKNMKPLSSDDVTLSCVPLFHVFGVFSAFIMAAVGGSIVFLNKLPPSNEEIFQALIENQCTMMCTPALILEQAIPYIRRTDNFTALQKLKCIIFGGAPLKKECGDWFHQHQINVRSFYGSTEAGIMMCTNLNDRDHKNWNAIRPFMKDKQGEYYGCFELNDPKHDSTIYHFYIRASYPGFAHRISNREDGGYDTNDLFKEDPDYPGYYMYIGRRDDTLVMVNGEKTNPVPMEASLRQHPLIKQAVIIGQGRQLTAVLIELDQPYSHDYSSKEEIVHEVNEAVNKMNMDCPNHSIVLPQMITILPFHQFLPSTDKGTVQRKKAEQMYQDIIDKMYNDFLEGPSKKIKNNDDDTSHWTKKQTQEFLINCVSQVLHLPISIFKKDLDQSIFDLGLNSLTAIQLRNKLSEYYDDVSQNFLFQHPSIHSICDALMNHQQNEDVSQLVTKRIQQTEDIAKEYIKKANKDFPTVAKNEYNQHKQEKVILLTGVTGSLGSFMLAYLLKQPDVKKVYCCIRGNNDDQLKQRLENAFTSRKLDMSFIKDDPNRVQVLPMKFNEPYLGFGKERYYQLKKEITMIQHCAWLLDFNMPVDHFDKECIAPFYHLLKFAYHEINPMHVHFISSISATAAYGPEILEEPVPFDAKITMPMGYAQSKFIVEVLFDYLTTEKNFPCYIERLGQVCGDSVNGVWNTSEQYPLMFIGGGSVMHKMPVLNTVIDWIPVDYAAQTIADIMLSTFYDAADRDHSVYHIVNPQLIQWKDVLQAMKSSGMSFDIVPPSDWVASLAQDDQNPAYTLMGFYETNFMEEEAFKMPVWKTTKTSTLAPILDKSPIIDTCLFSKFLKSWQSVGFYDPSI